MTVVVGDPEALGTGERGEAMREPEEVAAMVRLRAFSGRSLAGSVS